MPRGPARWCPGRDLLGRIIAPVDGLDRIAKQPQNLVQIGWLERANLRRAVGLTHRLAIERGLRNSWHSITGADRPASLTRIPPGEPSRHAVPGP